MKNKIKIGLITVFLLMLPCWMFGQSNVNVIVSGTVIDKDKQPCIGVSVIERDAQNRTIGGTVTDINGKYQIKLTNPQSVIVFSYIGYKTQTIKLKANTTVVNIAMEESYTELAEAVVTANAVATTNTGMMSVSKRSLASSSSTVKVSDLENLPAASIEELLDGRVSGLLVSMSSGDPGSGAVIQLRGAASLGLNTKPLIVVDGIPWTENIPDNNAVDLNTSEGLSTLLNIAPGDIAAIEVLKDAAATAIYGSEGSNGVIVISTKRGDMRNPSVSFTSKSTLTEAPKLLPLLNGMQYKTMILESYQNRYNMTRTPEQLFLEPDHVDYYNYNNDTDWLKEVIRLGYMTDNNVSIRGGGNTTGYSVSMGYVKQIGNTIGADYSRMTGRLAFDYKVSDKIKFITDFAYAGNNRGLNNANRINVNANLGSENAGGYNIINTANIIAPVRPVFRKDKYGNLTHDYYVDPLGFQGNVINPVALADLASTNITSDQINSSVQLELRPLRNPKTLFISSVMSLQYQNMEYSQFLPYSVTGKEYSLANIQSGVNESTHFPQYGLTLYQKNWTTYSYFNDLHNIMLGGGTIYRQNSARAILLITDNTPSEFITDPYPSQTYTTFASTATLARSFSLVIQALYIYGDRYSFQASIRRDGSSSFGGNNRYGIFPTISGFWRPSSEPFMSEQKWLNDLKIRASWGITGRSPSISASNAATFISVNDYGDLPGVKPENFELSALRWEKTEQTNLGVDFSAFTNRLSFTFEVYNNVTNDLLWNRPIASNSGFSTAYQNYGSIRNRGIEFDMTVVPVKTKDWRLSVSFNTFKNESMVLSLPTGNEITKQSELQNGQIIQRIRVGDPLGCFYGLHYKGVYSTDEDPYVRNPDGTFVYDLNKEKIPVRWNNQSGYAFQAGDAMYEDINNDGVINMQDVVKIGDSRPKFAGGMNVQLSYKGFTLMTQWSYRYGNEVFNASKMRTTNMYDLNNQTTAVMRRWRKQGDVTDVPRALYGAGYNWVGSDRYVEDASYIRLADASLAYRFKPGSLSKLRVKGLTLSLTATNVLLLTKYSGVDPEVVSGSNTDPFKVGQDDSITPRSKMYAFSVVLSF